MLEFVADIYLLREDEGGMTKEGFSGMMPSFSIKNDLIMCKITHGEPHSILKRGEDHTVVIQLPYGELYKDHISEGLSFTLNTGSRIIARGIIISIP